MGLPLFLFNYSDRKLHGIFEAAGPGQMNVDPYAWTSNGSERTSYPAQVSSFLSFHVSLSYIVLHIGLLTISVNFMVFSGSNQCSVTV